MTLLNLLCFFLEWCTDTSMAQIHLLHGTIIIIHMYNQGTNLSAYFCLAEQAPTVKTVLIVYGEVHVLDESN